jgi:hypothetical protein
MENWIHDNLEGGEVITTSETGYSSKDTALIWLNHFINHTKAGPDQLWKLLLLDGHSSHSFPQFTLLADANHIALITFPAHATHFLQPLDVGCFGPWKHYHNQAIYYAIRNYEYELQSLLF